jgi:hypothetical protein
LQIKKGKSEKDASKSAYAICTAQFKKAGKRYKEMENTKLNFVVPIIELLQQKDDDKLDNVMRIEGVAIEETTSRNNVTYKVDELEMAADTLVGAPLLKDHNNTVDGIVGKVTEAYMDGKQLKFKAEVMDDSMKEKIKNGLIKNVSVGSKLKELQKVVEDEVTKFVAKGIEFLELSLVAVPGVKGATFSQSVTEAFDAFEVEERNNMENKLKAIEEKLALLLAKESEEEVLEEEPEAEAEAEEEVEDNTEMEEKFSAVNKEMNDLKSALLEVTKELVSRKSVVSENTNVGPEYAKGELVSERGNYWQEWDMSYWKEKHPLAKLN